MDVDGTLTNGKIWMGNEGEEYKAFDVKDGYGIAHLLPLMKITPVVITGRKSEIVERRCRELGILECHQGCVNKMKKMEEVADRFECVLDNRELYPEIVYIGDDENDLECMRRCGFSACPADAVESIKEIANFVSNKNGGDGAVREVIESIKETNVVSGKWVKDVMKAIALYLPQFYRTPENDEWWGEGFTEWTAVKNAQALYEGHNQPREPFGDNYYNLLDKKVMEWQADLAKKYSVGGFCFYHYWFANGKKMLEKPAENLLRWTDIDMPFCFEWANEPWIRTWGNVRGGNVWSAVFENKKDAGNGGILLKQMYGKERQWKEHFEYLLPFFMDERYIRVDGKPVFSIYKPELIPRYCLESMIVCWRELAEKAGLGGLFFLGVKGNEKVPNCFDAWRDMVPGNVMLKDDTNKLLARDITGARRISYDTVWNRILKRKGYDKKGYWCGIVDFDTTPRKGANGVSIVGASPNGFRYNFEKLVKKSLENNNDFIFINAWNEWGEGMYLEPDKQHGYAYLEAVNEVMSSHVSDIIMEEPKENEDAGSILKEKDEYIDKFKNYFDVVHKWLAICQQDVSLTEYFITRGYRTIAIYGFGILGKHLYDELKDTEIEVKYAIDGQVGLSYIKVFSPEDVLPVVDAVIVTATFDFTNIEHKLRSKVDCPIVSLEEVVDVEYYHEEQ